MYRCTTCGGWFLSAHYCVGASHTESGNTGGWGIGNTWPRNQRVICTNCGQKYNVNEAHRCPVGDVPHTEFPVTERPLKDMLQELIDLLKSPPTMKLHVISI